MYQISENEIKISVRNLVEFILRSGDIDNTMGRMTPDAMQEGSRIHRKIQKSMGTNYTAEVPLSLTVPVTYEGVELVLTIEGRADGIIQNPLGLETEEGPAITIDEIKGIYMDLAYLNEPFEVHRAQAMCYAYIYAKEYEHKSIGLQMTYCNLDTEAIKHFKEVLEIDFLSTWFQELITQFSKWAVFQYQWAKMREQGIKQLEFPFEYRPGQRDLVAGVYRSILRDKKLFIEAPTGVGKTISTVFPTVKAMGEGLVSKIFYLTAKTITRTVAEEAFSHLKKQGLLMKVVSITAKEKICVCDKIDCNPVGCERAKGHYDRVNDAVYDLITNENDITRDVIQEYAGKHCVCPFEMCLDISLWCDAIICDYNYVFDPNVYLRRFFGDDKKKDYVFLIDEAHNLVDRGREMYSASLLKEDFLKVKNLVKEKSKKLALRLENCNGDLLKLKRNCDSMIVNPEIGDFVMHLLRLMSEYEEFLTEHKVVDGKEEILMLYLNVRHFLNIYETHDERYVIYTDYDESNNFRLRLFCIDPSRNLLMCMNRVKSSILFSATLLPIQYYKEQLGGSEEDYAIYAPSPFLQERRLLMIGRDVSTRYTRRGEAENQKMLQYIKAFISAKVGNYLVFFPSYQLMNQVAELAREEIEGLQIQSSNMTEVAREEFLKQFVENPTETRVGFCVMGGIYSEGIDLKHSRLIGAVLVGTGLPMICNERELIRDYFQSAKGKGFDYAYLYQGMNKVMQSAGRVIRTIEDYGAILLLDERFLQNQYTQLFPREWFPYEEVNVDSMKEVLMNFWEKEERN